VTIKTVIRNIRFPLIFFLLIFSGVTSADCNKDPECDDFSAWVKFTKITLRQTISGSDTVTDWTARYDKNGVDLSIDVGKQNQKKRVSGTIGLVGGRVMLSKGMKLEPGYEIDELDGPVLNIKLVWILLNRVFPKGPDSISGTVKIDHTGTTGIKFATPSASGYIPKNWRVNGKVVKNKDQSINYRLELRAPLGQKTAQDSTYTINMSGKLAFLGKPVFSDSDSLEGWTIYGIGPQQTRHGKDTIYDYGAKATEKPAYQTIGDIRAFIAAENDPGYRDDNKNFTGFWKEKCDQAFGLQIMHYGNEGKYSIVFCGPGGCGDPANSNLTYITGDKHFKVISEDKLVQIGRSGNSDTYIRCTTDPHPALKY